MMKARLTILAVVLGLSGSAHAAEVRRGKAGDELEDRIPAVSGHLFMKKKRHELGLLGDLTLSDAFRQKLIGNLAYNYHATEWLSFAGRIGYAAMAWDAGVVKVCPSPDQCDGPGGDTLNTLPGNLGLIVSLLGEFSPLYGKLNIIAENVIHFDVYATAGLSLTSYRLDRGGSSGGMTVGIPVGVGQRFFFNEWIALRLEFLDLLYLQPDANDRMRLRGQLMFTAGVSFFFPTTFSYDG